tara:strand:- start:11911 stop:12630 length:720 start_codon:yes stop_codon:yes gene_type:complete
MKCSEKINELLTALHTARQGFKELEKNGQNFYFKSKAGKPHMYSTLDDIFNACKDSLWENGVEVFYSTAFDGTFNILSTTLVHISSGQWMQSDTAIGDSATKPQEIGSGITYMRRYHIQAMLNLEADFEDDGNIAHGRSGDNIISPPATPNKASTAAFDYSGPPYRVFDGNDESARFQEVKTWGRHMKNHGSAADVNRRKANPLNISEVKRIRSEVPHHQITEAQKAKMLESIDGLGMS